MTQPNEQPAPVKLTRVFDAPRDLVFQAWSSAEHVRHWFSPEAYSVPEARVEMRVGGAFDVCMRGPGGHDVWTRGTFTEISPNERLVLDLYAVDDQGRRLFRAYTEVNFTDDVGKTRLDIVQTYTFEDPVKAAAMVKGAPVGWAQTLDKLEVEIRRMQAGGRP